MTLRQRVATGMADRVEMKRVIGPASAVPFNPPPPHLKKVLRTFQATSMTSLSGPSSSVLRRSAAGWTSSSTSSRDEEEDNDGDRPDVSYRLTTYVS